MSSQTPFSLTGQALPPYPAQFYITSRERRRLALAIYINKSGSEDSNGASVLSSDGLMTAIQFFVNIASPIFLGGAIAYGIGAVKLTGEA
jgi:hypothetical protein